MRRITAIGLAALAFSALPLGNAVADSKDDSGYSVELTVVGNSAGYDVFADGKIYSGYITLTGPGWEHRGSTRLNPHTEVHDRTGAGQVCAELTAVFSDGFEQPVAEDCEQVD